MLRTEELQGILFKALEDTSQVYTGHVQDPAAYVADGKAHLLAHLLNPAISATATPEAHARSCKVTIDRLDGYALAHSKGSWLLYSDSDRLFWLAWGSDPLDLQGGFKVHVQHLSERGLGCCDENLPRTFLERTHRDSAASGVWR